MPPPETIAPDWFRAEFDWLAIIARNGHADPVDAGLMMRMLRSIESPCIFTPSLQVREGCIQAWWESGPCAVSVIVGSGRIGVGRFVNRAMIHRPDDFPREPIAQLRVDLGWAFPRLAGGCDVDQMYDLIPVGGGQP